MLLKEGNVCIAKSLVQYKSLRVQKFPYQCIWHPANKEREGRLIGKMLSLVLEFVEKHKSAFSFFQ